MQNRRILLIAVTGLLLTSSSFGQAQAKSKLNDCHGMRQFLAVSNLEPYVDVFVPSSPNAGYFIIDYGTTSSTIDWRGFDQTAPSSYFLHDPVSDIYTYNFVMFGDTRRAVLAVKDYSNINARIRQAGIIGTDYLSQYVITLDYLGTTVFSSKQQNCSPEILKSEGFKDASSAGHFVSAPAANALNVPGVYISIGGVKALAQLDSGYADALHRHSININQAYFDALKKAGLELQEDKSFTVPLTTCAGVFENVYPWRISSKPDFVIPAIDGQPALNTPDFYLTLKPASTDTSVCGGIAGMTEPAAQVGTSFLYESGQVIFDPFAAKVWFGSAARH